MSPNYGRQTSAPWRYVKGPISTSGTALGLVSDSDAVITGIWIMNGSTSQNRLNLVDQDGDLVFSTLIPAGADAFDPYFWHWEGELSLGQETELTAYAAGSNLAATISGYIVVPQTHVILPS